MRVFKWSVDFQLNAEPSMIPAWIALEGLPIQPFNKATLFYSKHSRETYENRRAYCKSK